MRDNGFPPFSWVLELMARTAVGEMRRLRRARSVLVLEFRRITGSPRQRSFRHWMMAVCTSTDRRTTSKLHGTDTYFDAQAPVREVSVVTIQRKCSVYCLDDDVCHVLSQSVPQSRGMRRWAQLSPPVRLAWRASAPELYA